MQNDGKYLENEVADWAEKQARADLIIKRLPDTRSARNIIEAQNADFLCSRRHFGAFHLECKSTRSKKLELNMFRQYPTMRRWDLAGTPGFVLIHFYTLGTFVLIGTQDLEKIGLTGKRWKIPADWRYQWVTEDFNVVMSGLMALTESHQRR